MKTIPMADRWPLAAACFLACVAAAPPAGAGHSSPAARAQGHASEVRLIQGPLLATGQHIVGVQIDLEGDWYTYWRNPGDSGVPPVFDWSGSANLAGATPEYPAPVALRSPYGTSIGYHDEVVFPILVTPVDDGAPLDLVLRLDYAVCLDICVPQTADLALTVDPEGVPDASQVGLVNRFRALVPREQEKDGRPEVAGSRAEARGGRVVLVVEAAGEAPAELFVEGPPEFYFAVPDAVEAGSRGPLEFTVGVDGAERTGDLAGARLRATLVTADGAVQHEWVAE